ncbi:amino acid adenylation domain-containing protein [Oscillatoria sp. FACHB-1407]|uniref:non-ribosomal peptide synthetase n=1 Tax=Oscillatoria sp. FACHB-1407 TaxID=2692847 RepID=UPI001686544B|nr:non-ribosomal peptide synthetase [Oscillatoria sp. FACHB-1407]MBD2460792.1 amino acid adenylation domain-containing protein [Oscillatoria sp. FACHB-1407]
MTHQSIAEFVSHLKSLDVQVFVEGDDPTALDQIRLRCSAPTGTLTTELRQALSDRKAELVAYLHRKTANNSILPITPLLPHPSNPLLPHPLSFAQQRLWFLYQLAPDNPFYNVPAAIRLTGNLDQTALERSFQAIVRRHAALRTRFTTLDGEPVQIVEPNRTVELTVVNLQTVAVSERERISQQLATAEAQRPFNLETDGLLRITLLQFDSTHSVLLLTLHHIVADGWSLGVLIQELATHYTAFIEGRSPTLSPLPIQYSDFAHWQRNQLQGEILEKQLTYWRRQLRDLPGLELPSDRPRSTVQTYRGATFPLQIAPALTQTLEALSQESGASLFMTLLAAFQTLLYRYTGQTDLAIGSPIANRHRSELEGLIGFFVNSLVLRADLSGNPTFREWLERVRQVALAAYEHQDLPFEKLVEELDPDRDLSRNPLFQVAFALQNAPMQPLELPELMLEPAPLESGSTRFDLEVHLWEPAHGLRSLWRSQDGLSGFIAYSTDLFDRDRIGRLIGHFQTLLQGIVANPDARLSELPLLTPAEHQQIWLNWGRSPFTQENNFTTPLQEFVGATPNLCFHHIFEAQAQQDPEAIALVTEQGSLTYSDLNQQAEHLAQRLQQMGVQPNTLVGLCVDRSADMVIGILGILKAGGAYVPLDPSYPSDRLQFMLTDTQVAILLTQSWLVENLPTSSAQILRLDQSPAPSPLLPPARRTTTTPNHLAYVIYTSGSTGTPKGVLLTHRGLCNVVAAQQQVFQLSRHSRILQFSSISFDASIFEMALALGSGGTLYIPPKPAQQPGMALVQFLQENAITHALITPAALAVLPAAELPDLQVLITGGEACSSQVVDHWAVDRHFFNAYGPTETTIWATVAELHPGDNPLIIGRPILNTQVYILDAHLNPLPAGIPGELYIGGAGVAQGYLNRPELTAERFMALPLPPSIEEVPQAEGSTLVYKTGDRAQYRPDGTIEFLGRVDHQVKIRGFRVELGEIEATVQRHPAIQDAVVIASEGASNEKRLITYFTLNQQHLQQTLLPSLQNQQIQHWQTLYNQTYQSRTPHSLSGERSQTARPTPHFNTTGWNSSYTGEPIPLEQMQEWVSDRVQQILALNPRRVLEIGCGTGLLLFQIAPHCQKYVGTDFSSVSLESIQNQLSALNLPHVELLQRVATDFEDIDLASFDVVILNSIVQYFPSQPYLLQVLEGALQAVTPGGVVFIGDVRNLSLLTAFHSWMRFCQADANLERNQLQQQVERSHFEEPELAIAPAFFEMLRDRFENIGQVQIRLSRGRSHNEMTQFRYNVLLQTWTPESLELSGLPEPDQQHHWKRNPITVKEIQAKLLEHRPERWTITNITNSRVHKAVKIANWLRTKDAPKTVGRMREDLQNFTDLAIDPQDWWDLETTLPYHVEITWSTQPETGDYDVVLTRRDIEPSVKNPQRVRDWGISSSLPGFTNHPLQSNFARQLIPQLRHYLRQTLPDYMVPSTFIPLASLPLTASGKLDRRALPAFSDDWVSASTPTSTPLTPTETTLVDIWKELLQLKHVNIHDNFFELGGHSLLATQMTSRIRDAFELELPLKSVFEAPTIAQLAPILETLRDAIATPQAPPIVRLDRAAYRRKRSMLSNPQPETLTSNLPLATGTTLGQDSHPPGNESSETQNPQSNIQNSTVPPSPFTARSPLIPLTLGHSKQPFFCVHPMFGVVFPYLELAHHLANDGSSTKSQSNRSFYGLQPLGLDGQSPPLNRIEAIATYYLQAIQTLQPEGPYFLGGWSFGGLVALEMAQQLTQAGHPIALLAILDTPAPVNKLSFWQNLKFLLGTALWSTLPFLLDYGALAVNRLRPLNSWLSRWQWSAIAHLLPEESRLQLLDESAMRSLLPIVYANAQAAYRYVPQPYSQRITLFKATEQPDAIGHDPTLGWGTLANDIQVHLVPGNHLSLLQQPHVQTLAQQLRQYL